MELLLQLRNLADAKLLSRLCCVDGAWLSQKALTRIAKAEDCLAENVVTEVCQRLMTGKVVVECRSRQADDCIKEAKAWREIHPKVIPALKFSMASFSAMKQLAGDGVLCCFFNVRTVPQIVLAGKSQVYAIVPSMDIINSAYNTLDNYDFGRNLSEEQPGEVSWRTQLWCWVRDVEEFETAVDVVAATVVLDARMYQSLVNGG